MTLAASWIYDSVRLFKELLNKNANVDLQNLEGKTALMLAVESGNLVMVRALLSKNANINLVDSKGNTALTLAKKHDNTIIAEALHVAKNMSKGPSRIVVGHSSFPFFKFKTPPQSPKKNPSDAVNSPTKLRPPK